MTFYDRIKDIVLTFHVEGKSYNEHDIYDELIKEENIVMDYCNMKRLSSKNIFLHFRFENKTEMLDYIKNNIGDKE